MRHLVAIPTIMNKHGGADDWFGDYLCVYCANLQVDAINLQKQNFPAFTKMSKSYNEF